jgi:hypothetical protein
MCKVSPFKLIRLELFKRLKNYKKKGGINMWGLPGNTIGLILYIFAILVLTVVIGGYQSWKEIKEDKD